MNGKDAVNIDAIRVLPLFGTAVMFDKLTEALDFIKQQPEDGRNATGPLVRIEVQVRYSDGSRIEGQFPNKFRAIEFLKNKEQGVL